MKIVYAILLILLVVFVADDLFYVATLWGDFRPQDVVVHSTFAVGAFVVIGFNGYVMLVGTPLRTSAHVKLVFSYLCQVLVLGIISEFIIAAWKGYLYVKGSADALWSNLSSLGFLLFLLSVLAGLIIWSKRQSMPNPSFKRDALKRAP